MHLELQHHLGQVFDGAEVLGFLGAQIDDAVTTRQVHTGWYGGKTTFAFFRYECHYSLLFDTVSVIEI